MLLIAVAEREEDRVYYQELRDVELHFADAFHHIPELGWSLGY